MSAESNSGKGSLMRVERKMIMLFSTVRILEAFEKWQCETLTYESNEQSHCIAMRM